MQRAEQGAYEGIVAFNECVDDNYLESYNNLENPEMADEDIAMDFKRGSDGARYGAFQTLILNDITLECKTGT